MLSGISHDLRTPLTRIKLQLSFIKDNAISKKLSDDVLEMEKMLNEYLEFSRSRFLEKTERFNISNLLKKLIEKHENVKIISNIDENIEISARKNLIQRCINNILDNSLKYGENIHVQLTKTSGQILVIIDDDGPGIEKKEYENVFRPFYKINKGRGDSKSSVGLGMSIASDIVRSHGGNIILDNSPLKGLRVKIFLPF